MGRGSHSASFERPAEAYDRFVGRYGAALAEATVARLGLAPPATALDVGCGPGPLTAVLARVLGAERVAAVDPSEQFAGACAARVPGADVHVASAEALPFAENAFDATLSQLVVNFLPDAPAGLREMARVTRPGGTIAASVWDYTGEMIMLRAFWDAAVATDPEGAGPIDEGRRMKAATPDALEELWAGAGLDRVETGAIVVGAPYRDFEDLWEPFTFGVGPAGAYCVSLDQPRRDVLREEYRRRVGAPEGPFELSARAWLVRGALPA